MQDFTVQTRNELHEDFRVFMSLHGVMRPTIYLAGFQKHSIPTVISSSLPKGHD
jgi:hypothetical protein